MRRRLLSLAPLPAIALILLPAASAGPKVTRSEMISYDTLHDASGGDDLVHEFSQKPARVRVTVECKLKRGTFAWRVEDPERNVLWKQSATAKSRIELEEEFPGHAGRWRIVIDYKEARGSYHIKMEAVSAGSD